MLRLVLVVVLSVVSSGCVESSSRRPQQPSQYPQQQYPQGQYPQQQQYPNQYPPQQQYPQQQPNPTAQPAPAPAPLPPMAPASGQPINSTSIPWLRQRTQLLLNELIAALPPASAQRVQGIPLIVDDTVGDVNAFAACVDGRSLMAVTDGLLDIAAHLAQATAFDEVFGTRKLDEYIQLIAIQQRPKQPIVRPPFGFFPSPQNEDPRKLVRQEQVLDEMLGFVMAHELGHHYLGHLPCTAQPGGLIPGQVARVLSNAVPLFNQPNELAADVAGTNNILTAGKRRPAGSYQLTEAGGLLTMRFFAGLRRMSALDILFSFESSHPPPQVRTPVIQQAASTWRFTGGAGLPVPVLGR